MRFGKIQNIDDIDKAFEDLDRQHSELLDAADSRSELMVERNLGSSQRFTSEKAELEQLRISKVKEIQRNEEPKTETERQLNEIAKDIEIRRRLIAAHGPRLANIGGVGVAHMNQKYEDFYQPIPEDKQIQLQQKLS